MQSKGKLRDNLKSCLKKEKEKKNIDNLISRENLAKDLFETGVKFF